jgi:activator of HSP90 ATPase
MKIEFEISAEIDATSNQIYEAWLNSELHSAMTGGEAKVSGKEGESFEAWDGYIRGKNLELETNHRILQQWRTSEFDDSDEDSLLEIVLESQNNKTHVIIRHTNLPDHGLQYKQGWVDAYFTPMNKFFTS